MNYIKIEERRKVTEYEYAYKKLEIIKVINNTA